jgi:hypothetical protein
MTKLSQKEKAAMIERSRHLTLQLVVFAAFLCLQNVAEADDFAYVTTGTQGFGNVDLDTGAFTQSGVSGAYLYGLGEYAGTLYGVSSAISGGAATNTLYSIDPANGALTAVAPTSVGLWLFGSTSSGLFGLGANYTDLYSINPTNGVATLIGPTGISTRTTSGLSVGANGLYLMISSPASSSLYSLNTSTGAGTLVGSSSPGVCLKSMTFEDGTLYDASGYCVAGSEIFTVNPTNGSANFIADVSGLGDLNGMAPVFAAPNSGTPEPATMSLVGLGFIAMFLRWIRRALTARKTLVLPLASPN